MLVISMVHRGNAAAETTSVLLTKPLLTAPCLSHQALHHCRGPGSIPNNSADVCGFLEPPGSDRYWKVRTHDAFFIPRKTLALRPTDQSCHRKTWLHLDFADWRNTWVPQGEHGRHISLKERPASYHHGQQKRRISDVMSDHSLSS